MCILYTGVKYKDVHVVDIIAKSIETRKYASMQPSLHPTFYVVTHSIVAAMNLLP